MRKINRFARFYDVPVTALHYDEKTKRRVRRNYTVQCQHRKVMPYKPARAD